MNYELAKKLKNAGFPQKGMDCNWITNPEAELEEIYVPTLSELIEACGDKFYGIHRMVSGIWIAFMYDIEDSSRQVEAPGSTPEEAVALLWLELQNK